MSPRRVAPFGFLLLLLLGLPPARPAAAEERPYVDLELVLAVDVSRSMDRVELEVQRSGYVAAFRHPQVLQAITGGLHRRIAVTYVEWAGIATQEVIVPWTLVDGPASAEAFAARLEAAPIREAHGTSISGGLAYAARRFAESGVFGLRRVVDISGDGPNNQGIPVTGARDALVEAGITINGLPLLLGRAGGFLDIRLLDVYYEDCVIGGPGAFMVPVTDMAEFGMAVRRKLILEIAGLPARPEPARLVRVQALAPRIDCLIGEKLWQNWMNDN
ncbi:Protein of unknown function [Tistlia consotensis]|uniref:VWFA domain-containing protein n=1 Tax=Tistlia consotensis USBA 355 TaxID=560819 RepID=A0A1Y6CP42_9PROT|nr:DUF1194 domain-containing protein [Tistlia consotensis]SMF80337.1 Protein of unknown function [Tistlia consotensis USBA 355]SNR62551.1 Protein of unknown function [Tistlia consotensis]